MSILTFCRSLEFLYDCSEVYHVDFDIIGRSCSYADHQTRGCGATTRRIEHVLSMSILSCVNVSHAVILKMRDSSARQEACTGSRNIDGSLSTRLLSGKTCAFL